METPTFQNYIKEIYNLERELITDIIKPLEIILHYKDTTISLKVFRTNTIIDLKLAVYNYFDKLLKFAPNNQFIFSRKDNAIEAIDFHWNITEPLEDPSIVQTVNNYFVDVNGEKKIVEIQLYDTLLLETKLTTKELYLYTFEDLINNYDGIKPISSKEYNGKFYPYFPYLIQDIPYPNNEAQILLENRLNLYLEKRKFYKFIQSMYEKIVEGTGIEEVLFTGFRSLQFISHKSNNFKNSEIFFYETNVNEVLQYMRLMTPGNNPILKLHLKDEVNKIPSVHDIEFIKNWHDEKNPTPKRSFILGKIALQSTILNLPYIYATIRISSDGTFDLMIEPPKGIRKLHPNNDFEDLVSNLEKGVAQLNPSSIEFNKGSLIYSLQLASTKKTFNRKILEKRLNTFKTVFQEILPLPNEQPLIMLRYKLVDNYSSEDNISTFLTLLTNKKILHGEYSMPEIVELVSEEFQLDIESAREKVLQWFRKKEELQQIVIGETKEFTPLNNSGIDIAIFQKKNFYTFHIYNVDTIIHLKRIITSLNILFSFDDEDFIMTQKDSQRLDQLEASAKEQKKDEVDAEEQRFDVFDDGDIGSQPGEFDELGIDERGSNYIDEEDVSNTRTQEIRKAIADDGREIEEDMPVAPVVKKQTVIEEKETSTDKGVANFFIRKLQELDKALFEYEPKNPKDKTYVQTCAANEMRQPAVLSEAQYISMKKEYAEDIDEDEVAFHEYPIADSDRDELPSIDPDKIITVLRYGSNKRRPSYYLCSEYFCTRDEIVVLKKDFLGSSYRPKRYNEAGDEIKKDRERCPFCDGELVKNRRSPGVNQTVLQRIYKPNTTKRHTWIHFLKKTPHPNGLKLPCCFIKPSPIYESETRSDFEVVKREREEDEEEYLETLESGLPILDYETTINRIQKKYIVGEIIPLEVNERDGPQIGLVPSILNSVLSQDSQSMIKKERETAQGKKLADDAKGFLRIGVENRGRYLNDSFLSAVAPFYFKNSAFQMKRAIDNVITPNIFMNLNYGNLVLEFNNPSLPFINYENTREKVTDLRKQFIILRKWANDYLHVKLVPKVNFNEVLRLYKSFYNFKSWLLSDEKKEYRHFAMLFAQAGLIREVGKKGLTFIVIDIIKRMEGDNEIEDVVVRCPSYGFNYELMINNDVAFLMHHYSGIWEPLFYVDNSPILAQFRKPYTMIFQRASYNGWPEIVKKLLGDFIKSCSGPGKSIYTSQSYLNSNTLIPLTLARNVLNNIQNKYENFHFEGLLRDPYNHIVAAVIQEERENEERLFTIVPIIDDGVLASEQNVVLNYRSIKFENAENTVRIYNKYILPNFPRYRKYLPEILKTNVGTEDVIAIQLKNNLIVPTSPSRIITKMNYEQMDEFEFDLNTKIIFSKDDNFKSFEKDYISSIKNYVSSAEIEEIYQHLRITFSNWLSKKTDTSILKYLKEDIFNSNLSLNDKRRFLFILFGSTILSWFTNEDIDTNERSLLRKDCVSITSKEKCFDKCVWTREGSCKIHASKNEDNTINIGEQCMYRLFDEIIRYSIKRKEVFNNSISRLVFLNEPILIGKQYVLPENTLEWYDLMRSEWNDKDFEKPKFYEEMSSSAEIILPPEEDIEAIFKPLPLAVKAYLDADSSKTKILNYFEITNTPSLSPLLNYLGLSDTDINYNGESPTFTVEQRVQLRNKLKLNIVEIKYLDTNVTRSTVPQIKLYPYLIILTTTEGSGLLIKNKSITPLNRVDVPEVLLLQ